MEYYEVSGKLGKGGFGDVYLAYDKMNESEVAIKFLNFA
jgi:serine/threonine protein kinase